MEHHLTDEERVAAALDYERLLRVIEARHGIREREIVEAVEWYRQHREWVSSMKKGGWLGLIGVAITAALMSLWEGVKAYARINTK